MVGFFQSLAVFFRVVVDNDIYSLSVELCLVELLQRAVEYHTMWELGSGQTLWVSVQRRDGKF